MRIAAALMGLVLVATACSDDETATTGVSFPTTTSSTSSVTATTTTTAFAPRIPTPPPTTTSTTLAPMAVPAGNIPVASVTASVEADYQARWDYYQPDKPPGIVGPVEIECDHEDDVGFGAVLVCEAVPLEEREYWPEPFAITILLTGENPSHVYAVEGDLAAEYQLAGAGKFCRDLIESDSALSTYARVVAYWFLEGRPDRLVIGDDAMVGDPDRIPCVPEFPLWDIANFWHGTSQEAATGIHFGTVTDVSARGSGFELTIDYAFFLGGLEADLAAEAAGAIQPGEGVPNDYFIVNENPRLRTFPLASDLYVDLLGHRETLQPIAVRPSDWIELLAEVERCEDADWPENCAGLGGEGWSWYGSGQLPYWIQLEGDTVIRIEEQYLP